MNETKLLQFHCKSIQWPGLVPKVFQSQGKETALNWKSGQH